MALNIKPSAPTSEVKVKPDKKKPTNGTLLEVMAAIKASKGDKVIVPGNAIPAITRLPTGIFEFDFYTGGGFPCGRYSIIYGPESSCKTNVCLKAVANAQKLPPPCNKAIWVDIEQSFDPKWAEKLGVNTEELVVVKAGYGEEAVDLIDALVRAEDVAIVVVDSVAALIANKEISQSTENYDIGTSALLIKRMVNKLMIAFGEGQKVNHFPCVVLINQTRFKPGVMFGDPETMPGGEAQKFLSSLRIRLYAKNVYDKATNMVTFKDTRATVKKAKVPVRAANFDFKLCVQPTDELQVGETDSFNTVKGHLQALGLLIKDKGSYKVQGLPWIFPTITAIADKYQQEEKFRMQLQAMVIANYKDTMVFVEEATFTPSEVPPGDVQPIADPETGELV